MRTVAITLFLLGCFPTAPTDGGLPVPESESGDGGYDLDFDQLGDGGDNDSGGGDNGDSGGGDDSGGGAGGDTGGGDDGGDSDDVAPTTLLDLVDHSVNQASAAVDGFDLHLRTETAENEVGGFEGSGTGNKAIAGLPGQDGAPLDSLDHLALEMTSVVGSSSPYFNVIVDLDCTGTDIVLVVADTTAITAVDLGDGWSRLEWQATDLAWRAVGGLDDVLPEHLSLDAGALADVVTAYPTACLRDAATGDGGMPQGVTTSAVMLILGDSQNQSEGDVEVSALEVGALRVGPAGP
jgi:hypothetical protein